MCWCDMFKIAVNPERGFSKSWHHMFVMSNICAFVLTWCLFVGNSRQTTSSVPWHRAPKYDRKHNLHLTIKRFLFKWSLISCMCRWRVCVASRETTVWIQEGELVKKCTKCAQTIFLAETLSGQSATVWSVLCYLHGVFDLKGAALMFTAPLQDSRQLVLQDGQTPLCFLVVWFF